MRQAKGVVISINYDDAIVKEILYYKIYYELHHHNFDSL